MYMRKGKTIMFHITRRYNDMSLAAAALDKCLAECSALHNSGCGPMRDEHGEPVSGEYAAWITCYTAADFELAQKIMHTYSPIKEYWEEMYDTLADDTEGNPLFV
jgi:hypothetical protein